MRAALILIGMVLLAGCESDADKLTRLRAEESREVLLLFLYDATSDSIAQAYSAAAESIRDALTARGLDPREDSTYRATLIGDVRDPAWQMARDSARAVQVRLDLIRSDISRLLR